MSRDDLLGRVICIEDLTLGDVHRALSALAAEAPRAAARFPGGTRWFRETAGEIVADNPDLLRDEFEVFGGSLLSEPRRSGPSRRQPVPVPVGKIGG